MASRHLFREEIETEVLEVVRRVDSEGQFEVSNPRYLGTREVVDPVWRRANGRVQPRSELSGQLSPVELPASHEMSTLKEKPRLNLGSGDGEDLKSSLRQASPKGADRQHLPTDTKTRQRGIIHIDRDLDTKVTLKDDGTKLIRREFREKFTMYHSSDGTEAGKENDPCSTFERVQVELDVVVSGKIVDSRIDYKEASDLPHDKEVTNESFCQLFRDADKEPLGCNKNVLTIEDEESLDDVSSGSVGSLTIDLQDLPPSNEDLTVEMTEMVFQLDSQQSNPTSNGKFPETSPDSAAGAPPSPGSNHKASKNDFDESKEPMLPISSTPTKDHASLNSEKRGSPDSGPNMSATIDVHVPQRERNSQVKSEEFSLQTTEIYFAETEAKHFGNEK